MESVRAREAIHQHNQQLLTALSEQIAPILDGKAGANLFMLIAFLKDELLPYALGEEQYLCPALDRVMKSYGKPTATMNIDHEYIAGYVDWIEETVEELETAYPEEYPALQALLQRLCLQLEAVLQVHMAQEERVYLPLFEEQLTEKEQQQVLGEMRRSEEAWPTCKKSIHALDFIHART